MHLALIGYGEVGRILAEDLRAQGHEVTAFDLKLRTSAAVALRGHSVVHGVTLAESHADAVRGAALTISAVTASQTRRSPRPRTSRVAARATSKAP